jgi:hypothetical protein
VATKKQKREVALAKREAFLEEERQRGLEAQKRGKEEENLPSDDELYEQFYVEMNKLFFGSTDRLLDAAQAYHDGGK